MPNVLVVPKKWLFLLAGILWTIAGFILCSRALIWADEIGPMFKTIVEIAGIILAFFGFFYGFSKIVKKNIKRIQSLPKRSSIFLFTSLQGYIMIICMILMGIFLRSLPFPKYLLSIPYMAMGVTLLIGCTQFYWQFILSLSKRSRK